MIILILPSCSHSQNHTYVYQSFHLLYYYLFLLAISLYYTAGVIVYHILLQYSIFSSNVISYDCDSHTHIICIPFAQVVYVHTKHAKITNPLIRANGEMRIYGILPWNPGCAFVSQQILLQ